MIGLRISMVTLVASTIGCVEPPPSVDAVNAPGHWTMRFRTITDHPENSSYAITYSAAPTHPDRIAELPSGRNACDASCDCVYEPAHYDEVEDRVYGKFTETCAQTNITMTCRQVEFTSPSHGRVVCAERPTGMELGTLLARYTLTLDRIE